MDIQKYLLVFSLVTNTHTYTVLLRKLPRGNGCHLFRWRKPAHRRRCKENPKRVSQWTYHSLDIRFFSLQCCLPSLAVARCPLLDKTFSPTVAKADSQIRNPLGRRYLGTPSDKRNTKRQSFWWEVPICREWSDYFRRIHFT